MVDEDCVVSYGNFKRDGTCDPTRSRCAFNESDVLEVRISCISLSSVRDRTCLQCLTDNLESEWATLFDYWSIPEQATRDSFLEALSDKILKPQCTGYNGIRYRCDSMNISSLWCLLLRRSDHWHYHADIYNCVDLCYDPSAGIDLELRCFERDLTTCTDNHTRELCSSSSFSSCFRSWVRHLPFSALNCSSG